MLTSPPIYEAAKSGEFPARFANLSDALQYIQGSEIETVRPWLRLANGQASHGNFLIVSGRAIDTRCPFPPPPLPDSDQELFSQWQREQSTCAQDVLARYSDAAPSDPYAQQRASA